jgi:hypothetical protein
MDLLLPVVVVAALFGLYCEAFVQADRIPPRSELIIPNQVPQFVLYRNAVVAFVSANPSFVGTVPQTSLNLAPGFAALASEGNQVVPTPSGAGRIIYAWAAIPGAAGEALTDTGGDLSYGTVSGSSWISPIGGLMGMLDVAIPNGDVVSVSQIGV